MTVIYREPLLLFSHQLEMETCLESIRQHTTLPFRAERVGIGPREARGRTEHFLETLDPPSAVLALGTAGWLTRSRTPGKPIWAREVKNERGRTIRPTLDLHETALGQLDLYSVRLVTTTRPVTDTERAQWLSTEIGAEAADMESFSILSVCVDANVACAVIRGISDRADSRAVRDYRGKVEEAMVEVGERAANLIAVIDKREQKRRARMQRS